MSPSNLLALPQVTVTKLASVKANSIIQLGSVATTFVIPQGSPKSAAANNASAILEANNVIEHASSREPTSIQETISTSVDPEVAVDIVDIPFTPRDRVIACSVDKVVPSVCTRLINEGPVGNVIGTNRFIALEASEMVEDTHDSDVESNMMDFMTLSARNYFAKNQ